MIYQAVIRIGPSAIAAGAVVRLPRGRKKISRAPIIKLAESAIKRGVDRSFTAFWQRVRDLLEHEGVEPPGDTTLKSICRPIYVRALLITEAAERAIEGGVDVSSSDLCDRVRDQLKGRISLPPGDEVLDEICRVIWLRALSAKNSPEDRKTAHLPDNFWTDLPKRDKLPKI
jgi:hypothetical protein